MTRTRLAAAAGVAQAAGVFFLPKCPLCVAMDAGILGSLGGLLSARAEILGASLALAAISAGALLVNLRRSRRGTPRAACHPER